jgi:hypothetical protein
MSDLTFEVTEFFQDKQQRFEAALTFTKGALDEGHSLDKAVEVGITCADKLIAELVETSK